MTKKKLMEMKGKDLSDDSESSRRSARKQKKKASKKKEKADADADDTDTYHESKAHPKTPKKVVEKKEKQEHKEVEKREKREKKEKTGEDYCIDCYLPIGMRGWLRSLPESPDKPWEKIHFLKTMTKKGRSHRPCQAIQQMEDYLSCVNSIYNKRSPIAHGLHDTQLVRSSSTPHR